MDRNRSQQPLYDVAIIKEQALQSMEDGAVTKDYPLDLKQAHELLNSALATEIMCFLRYRHHQIVVKGIDKLQISAEFKEHAMEEEKHMLMLAERINQLGGNPDFNPATVMARTATQYGSAGMLIDLLKEDLIAERIAISIYRHMIEWFGTADPTTRCMLEEILKDEENHADELADLLATSTFTS